MFWCINYSDPHQALCFNPLHVNDGGMWGRHLFTEVKAQLEHLGYNSTKKVDNQ